jgi:DNA-binding MarR family transcriptional regulator
MRRHAVRAKWLPYFTIDELQKYEAVLDRVLELVVLLNDDMTHAIEALDLTPSRTHLLWELGQGGPVTQRVLADALKVTPRAVTGLVDALVESGFVTREPHPADRRARLVTFTPEGKKLIANLQRDHRALARALFGSMSHREFDSFARGLGDVITSLRAHLASTGARPRAGGGRPG